MDGFGPYHSLARIADLVVVLMPIGRLNGAIVLTAREDRETVAHRRSGRLRALVE